MFGGGGGGLNPRKMQQMMKQMGIEVEDLDVEQVVIRTADEELVFDDVDVTRMDARGQQTYQVVGEPDVRPRSGGDAGVDSEGEADEKADDAESSHGDAIPDSDVEIVAGRAGVSKDQAREALEAENGDLAAAISRLE